MFINELSLIEAISKSLPVSWKLYVKEHPNMVGHRSFDFYKNAIKFHNVKLVNLDTYIDSKPWIEKSMGIVTITGSTAFEAAMLNKPAIVFGNVCFNVLSNIKVANNFNDLEPLFNLIASNGWPDDGTKSCAAYLKTIRDLGVNLDHRQLLMLSSKKICSETIGSQSLDANENENLSELTDLLISFYKKGIEIYEGKL